MRIVTSIGAGVAVLALGGGLFAAQAMAGPPAPAPAATASAPTDRAGAAVAAGGAVAWFFRVLSSDQRACLADAGVHRPDGAQTDTQRRELAAEMRAALAGCGASVPGRLADRPRLGVAWAGLTSAQQHCLARATITRPLGRLTDAERAAVRQSVRDQLAACGIGR